MRMTHTEEQEMLQSSVRKFFEKEVTTELIRKLQTLDSTGHSEELWRKMGRAGWLSIAIPEKYNGAGGTLLDLGIVYEESGKVLLPTTFYSTLFASFLIEAIGTEAQKAKYLSDIANGNIISTIAYMEPQAIHNPDCYQTMARKYKNRYYLTGTKSFVQNAHLAHLMIVIARTEDAQANKGLTAFLVEPGQSGVNIKQHHTFGKDRQSLVTFSEVELGQEHILGEPQQAREGLELAIKKATALQTLEMVGGMKKVVQMTVDYVSQRKQFGVPIGSFQAVQHHLANLATYRDGSELAAYQAISNLAEGFDAEREVSIAKAYASESYKTITVMAHQLWGGMGYATESDLFLWSNRAKAAELSFGTRDFHLNQLIRFIGSNDVMKQKTNMDVTYSI
ncbi:acyl-CoA dehydrogenase family protein [Neobacillus vireti]|uniref:acyl-CoA dehydrogenase family protein n=1 Tax=Neobacillus vireti TaxID=220686 RepID=UPI002FFFB299